jgi:predicted Zn-dependent protease
MIKRLAVVGAVLATVASCATNQYTHRSQLMLLSLSEEADLGNRAYQAMLKDRSKYRPTEDAAQVEVVERVAIDIVAAAMRSKYAETALRFDWQIAVFDDDKTRNAFALPGGKIGVFTGIYPVAKNEAGLAAILGHEVVHALARHCAERLSQGMVQELGARAADAGLQIVGLGPILSPAAAGALGIGMQVGVLMPYSRTHESEADYIGLLLAAQAGYDPREAAHVWERMEQVEKDHQPPEFLSTHPSHGTRIEQINAWMPEALALYHPTTDQPSPDLPELNADKSPPASPECAAQSLRRSVIDRACRACLAECPALTRKRPLHPV